MRTLTPGLLCRCLALYGVCALAVAPHARAADSPAGQPAAVASPLSDSASTSDPAHAATVGGQFISVATVDQRIAAQLMRLKQEQYELRAQAAEALMDQGVLEREASGRSITVEQLVEQRITSKVTPATAAEIDTFYARNRGQLGGRTREQAEAQIIETLKASRTTAVRAEYLKGLRQRHKARMLLEPPRFSVSLDDDPSRGSDSAPITIIEFSDFQCPFCSRGEDTINQVLERYGDRVRLVFRDFPLAMHPNAEGAAIAAGCAREQGKYWEMHRAMFANPAKLSATGLAVLAEEVGLDVERFKACMASSETRAEVQRDVADGQALGISGTPTFFINGVMIVGARELEVFTRTIDRELERLGK